MSVLLVEETVVPGDFFLTWTTQYYCINSHYVEDNSLKWFRNDKEGTNSSISIVLYPVKFIDKVIIVYTLIL